MDIFRNKQFLGEFVLIAVIMAITVGTTFFFSIPAALIMLASGALILLIIYI